MIEKKTSRKTKVLQIDNVGEYKDHSYNLDKTMRSVFTSKLGNMRWLMFGGKIEDRGVNSLFDCKEIYNGSIIQLQERGDIQAEISPLFNAGFLI